MPEVTYTMTEEAIANVFGVNGDGARTGVLRGLIQNLRRLGLPGGAPGPGQDFVYDKVEIGMWVVALALEKVGVPPSGAVRYVADHKARLTNLVRQARAPGRPDLCVIIETDQLSPRWVPRPNHVVDITASFRLSPGGLDTVAEFLNRDGSGNLLNLSAKLRALDASMLHSVTHGQKRSKRNSLKLQGN